MSANASSSSTPHPTTAISNAPALRTGNTMRMGFMGAILAIISLVFCAWQPEPLFLLTGFFGMTLTLYALYTLRSHIKSVETQLDEQKLATSQLITSQGKLSMLGGLAASIIHELNNPLMLIREHAGWINDQMEDLPQDTLPQYAEISHSAKKIEAQVDRASHITKRTLGFLHAEDTSAPINLHSFIQEIFDFVHKKADYKRIQLHAPSAPLETYLPNPEGVQQIIFNLIDNAIDAIDKNGSVTVSTALEANRLIIHVQDSGTGIPAHILPNIFSPFFTTKAQGQGTGLGLFICRTLAASMSGTLTVSKSSSDGTCFTLTLPIVNKKS